MSDDKQATETDKETGTPPTQQDQGGEGRKEEHTAQGYPQDTPIAEMTPDQQAAYWKYHSRKHEADATQKQERLEETDRKLQEALRRADLAELRLHHPALTDDILQFAPEDRNKLEEFAQALESVARPEQPPETTDPAPEPAKNGDGDGHESAKADALAASSMTHQGASAVTTDYEATLKQKKKELENQLRERNKV